MLFSSQSLFCLHSQLAAPTQAPDWQWSPLLQALPSSQVPPFGSATQPNFLSQMVGQPLGLMPQPSAPMPVHTPAAQRSPKVQMSLSSQTAPSLRALCRHCPVSASQLSFVQGFLSLQSTFCNGSLTQTPCEHCSVPAHLSLLAKAWQSSPLLQAQTLTLGVQVPTTQWSPNVHGLPSLQLTSDCGELTQPWAGKHRSLVHGLASSQLFCRIATHAPAKQAASLAQRSPATAQAAKSGLLTTVQRWAVCSQTAMAQGEVARLPQSPSLTQTGSSPLLWPPIELLPVAAALPAGATVVPMAEPLQPATVAKPMAIQQISAKLLRVNRAILAIMAELRSRQI